MVQPGGGEQAQCLVGVGRARRGGGPAPGESAAEAGADRGGDGVVEELDLALPGDHLAATRPGLRRRRLGSRAGLRGRGLGAQGRQSPHHRGQAGRVGGTGHREERLRDQTGGGHRVTSTVGRGQQLVGLLLVLLFLETVGLLIDVHVRPSSGGCSRHTLARVSPGPTVVRLVTDSTVWAAPGGCDRTAHDSP
ncbi:hypothetical protein VAB18032_24415 [Micromonospora maris AB-18-032]|uniref:Uncharacterized protein n=1 Tax=Micromonospora maris TaxID=1003110 RepID=A0A9X0LCN7_9ACTN|nr:hypothetical protein VAB18032_24415 [Micromonospora maris AB-18-032]KUJ45282.1 hypothetical protein ADL17_19545 [Micromonospora maris]